MEFKQHAELTRADLLEQLRKRELYVPNAECLAMEQLLHMYNSFIIPRPRRERRERRRTPTEALPNRPNQSVPVEFFKRPCELVTESPWYLLNSPRKRIKIELHQ